jgi:uncharacterized membrane protein
MTLAGGIFLITVGAILRFATGAHIDSLDLRAIGLVLMIVGLIGLLLGILQWVMWSRRSRREEEEWDAGGVDRRPRGPVSGDSDRGRRERHAR